MSNPTPNPTPPDPLDGLEIINGYLILERRIVDNWDIGTDDRVIAGDRADKKSAALIGRRIVYAFAGPPPDPIIWRGRKFQPVPRTAVVAIRPDEPEPVPARVIVEPPGDTAKAPATAAPEPAEAAPQYSW